MPPSAASTPSTPRTVSSTLASTGGSDAVLGLDLLVRGDDRVHALVRLGEDVVERLLDRVREHVGAGDHHHAEHDRQRGEDGAQLVRAQVSQRDRGHARRPPASSGRAPPRRWPSPRPGRSCRPPARRRGRPSRRRAASWVTMTTVWPKSSTARRSSASTSSLDLESRLPVGSSANTHRGLRHQRPSHRDPLLLAAGELGGAVAEPVAQSDCLDELVVQLRVGLAARQGQRQQDVLVRASAPAAG